MLNESLKRNEYYISSNKRNWNNSQILSVMLLSKAAENTGLKWYLQRYVEEIIARF